MWWTARVDDPPSPPIFVNAMSEAVVSSFPGDVDRHVHRSGQPVLLPPLGEDKFQLAEVVVFRGLCTKPDTVVKGPLLATGEHDAHFPIASGKLISGATSFLSRRVKKIGDAAMSSCCDSLQVIAMDYTMCSSPCET